MIKTRVEITDGLLEEAKKLANIHYEKDASIKDIFLIPSKVSKRINLLEVSADVPATGCLFPVAFSAADGMNYP